MMGGGLLRRADVVAPVVEHLQREPAAVVQLRVREVDPALRQQHPRVQREVVPRATERLGRSEAGAPSTTKGSEIYLNMKSKFMDSRGA